jgi:hypothetical protein
VSAGSRGVGRRDARNIAPPVTGTEAADTRTNYSTGDRTLFKISNFVRACAKLANGGRVSVLQVSEPPLGIEVAHG